MNGGVRIALWVIGIAVAAAVWWMLDSVLVPFIAAMVVAYMLDPAVSWIERRGLNRTIGASIVTFVFFGIVTGGIAVLAPVLQRQTVGLLERLITAGRDLLDWAWTRFSWISTDLGLGEGGMPPGGADLAKTVVGWVGGFAAGLWSGGMTLINILTLLFVMPIVAWYLLRDWPKIAAYIDGMWPRRYVDTIRDLLGQIDYRLSGFIRGQGLVCVLLGAYYGISLTLVGLSYGLIIGLLGGLLSFIPYLGTAIAFVLGLTVAFFQFDWFWIAVVAGILVLGQFVEGNFLTPVLVGERVGLHPVWLMFAVMAGGAMFGFVGVMISVPVAAALGVLMRHFLQRYYESSLYRSDGGDGPGAVTT